MSALTNFNKPVFVFGADNYNTLGLIRTLGKNHIQVHYFGIKSDFPKFCRQSKYVTTLYECKTIENGIKILLQIANDIQPHCKIVIIPTGDDVVKELDRHYNLLIPYYIIPNAGIQGRIDILMNKDLMNRYAERAGIKTPKTIPYKCGDQLPDQIIFPCITKPEKSICGTKKDIIVCENKERLETVVKSFDIGYRILIQQYIRHEYDLLLLGCRSSNGTIRFSGVFKKERWFKSGSDGSFGLIDTNYKKYVDDVSVISFLNSINYVGPFSIEYGVEKNVPYFYEINMRNDGTSHYFDKTGYSIPIAWVADEYNYVYDAPSVATKYYFIDEFCDILNVFRGNISIMRWLSDMKSASVYKYVYRGDNIPVLYTLGRLLAIVLKNTLLIILHKEKNIS